MEEEQAKLLREKIAAAALEQKLPCKTAFALAAEAGCKPAEVGRLCNEDGIKVVACQLGCF